MSIEKCLLDRVAAGVISKAQADEALRLIKKFEAQNRDTMSPEQALAKAAEQASDYMQRGAIKKKQQTALQILAQERVVEQAGSHKKGWAAGVSAVFARDIWGMAGYSNVEGRYRAVLGSMHALFADGLEQFRTKMAGLSQDAIGLQRFVRELYGENTGDATARSAAEAWNKTTQYGTKRFNTAGGNITDLEDWRLPQEWDTRKVKKAGRAAFEDYMNKAFNEGRLIIKDFDTGEMVDAETAAKIISASYETISTNGMNKLVPGELSKASVANARSERRAFRWANADAWLDFNRQWGVGDSQIYDVLTGHLDGLARDIAKLEILGPNPEHTARVLVDTAKKNGVDGMKAYRLQAIWEHVEGRAQSPVSEFVASTGRGIRSWLTSAQLGAAMLSSVSDFATVRAASAWNGLPTSKVIGRYTSLMAPGNDADRKLAVRLGMVAEGWTMRAAGAHRHQAEIVGRELPGRISEFVMRASLLAPHTQAGRWAFGMEFLGYLADQIGKGVDELDAPLQRAFETYGVTADDWARIQNHVLDHEGVKFIWPEEIARSGEVADMGAASRLMEMVNTEMDYAIPTPGAAERSLLLGQSKPGTFVGEFVRSMAQYKTFPVTIMTTHLMRGVSAIQGGDHGRYLAGTVIGMTAMGALAMQMKDVAKGRDPRDMTDAKFWGAAFVQGGGAGILGDFLYSGLNRSDRSFYMTMVGGPTGGLVDDFMRLTGTNISQTLDGEDPYFGKELARFVKNNTPGSSLWYSRLVMDRMLWDQIQMMTDPNYAASFARMEQRQRKEYGQEFWWRPGRDEVRAPDIGALFGQ
jgi:hypothetical protein